MSFGFRIGSERPRVSAALVDAFRNIPVANISDSMNRLTAGGVRLRPLGAASLAGPALTVKTAPGDNLMVHKAIDLGRPGDVIVVDAGGDLTNSIIGERMLHHAIFRKLGGFVINGAVRDAAALRASQMPVYAAGITHRGPYKRGPGEIYFPVAIEGMVVESGDLIVGDDDGMLCIPLRDAEAILVAAQAKSAHERATAESESDRSWIDVTLRKLGCEFAQEPVAAAPLRSAS